MAETRKADAGQAEVQDAFEEAQKKGYFGASPSTIPNEAYTLKTGPDSPSALEGNVAAAEGRVKAIKDSTKEAKSNG